MLVDKTLGLEDYKFDAITSHYKEQFQGQAPTQVIESFDDFKQRLVDVSLEAKAKVMEVGLTVAIMKESKQLRAMFGRDMFILFWDVDKDFIRRCLPNVEGELDSDELVKVPYESAKALRQSFVNKSIAVAL